MKSRNSGDKETNRHIGWPEKAFGVPLNFTTYKENKFIIIVYSISKLEEVD